MEEKQKFEFDAFIHQHGGMDATYIEFPYKAEEVFNAKGRVKVKAWYDGVLYRGSLAKMGMPCHILILVQEIRKQINKKAGDYVHVIIEQDTEERIIAIPEDIQKLFGEIDGINEKFKSLSYTKRKEYMGWVEAAKRPETRQKRIDKLVETLLG